MLLPPVSGLSPAGAVPLSKVKFKHVDVDDVDKEGVMKRRTAALACALVLGVSLLLASPGGPRPAAVLAQGMMPDGPALLAAAGNADEWLMYGHDYTNDRYSALDQINTSTVSQVADPTLGYAMTIAPLVYKNIVIVGTSGAEYGVRGYLQAHDAKTGAVLWRFYLIPDTGWEGKWATTTPEGDPLHRDIAKEKAAWPQYQDAWKRGGGSTWVTPAADPDLNMIYFGVGNPSPDLDGGIRPGDNLYTESIVAVNAANGKLAWYYQEVPHDVWDLDQTSPPLLFDVSVGGQTVHAVGAAGKTGWFYIPNRVAGERVHEHRVRKTVRHVYRDRHQHREGDLAEEGRPADDGRVVRHRGRARVHRRRQRELRCVRRQDRGSALAVPGRGGSQRGADGIRR